MLTNSSRIVIIEFINEIIVQPRIESAECARQIVENHSWTELLLVTVALKKNKLLEHIFEIRNNFDIVVKDRNSVICLYIKTWRKLFLAKFYKLSMLFLSGNCKAILNLEQFHWVSTSEFHCYKEEKIQVCLKFLKFAIFASPFLR